MAHGMGAQKDIGLHQYADKFAEAGIAVALFDYRGFGGSDGEPRHWVSPRRHLQDWWEVTNHALGGRFGERVDSSRMALWGVSYGGGHALVTASRLGDKVKAVVANEPYLSTTAALRNAPAGGVRRLLRLLAAGLSDELRRLLGLPPVYIPLVGALSDPSSLALLQMQDSELAIRSSNHSDRPIRQGGWRNLILARLVLEMLGYAPQAHLGGVTAPVFMRLAMRDHLCPPDLAHAAAAQLRGGCVMQERNETHLSAHATGVLPQEIAPVIEFLRQHLGLAEGGGGIRGEGVAEAGAKQRLGQEPALDEMDGELQGRVQA